MLAQPDQDDCLMRPGHLRWTLGGMTPSGYSDLRRPMRLSDRGRHPRTEQADLPWCLR